MRNGVCSFIKLWELMKLAPIPRGAMLLQADEFSIMLHWLASSLILTVC